VGHASRCKGRRCAPGEVVERSGAAPVGLIDVDHALPLNEQSHGRREMATREGADEGRPELVVLRVGVGPHLHEGLDNLEIAVGTGHVEACLLVLIEIVDVGVVVDDRGGGGRGRRAGEPWIDDGAWWQLFPLHQVAKLLQIVGAEGLNKSPIFFWLDM